MMGLGKTWGLRRLTDANGYFTMLALDQRPPIQQVIARARGCAPDEVGYQDVVQVKRLLASALGREASAALVDPNFGYPAAVDMLDPGRGLVVTLEDHRFDDGPDGRRSASIADWSVDKIRMLGGDAVKVLAWYRPDAAPAVVEHQQAYVRAIGERCRALDIPFLLELLVYPFRRDGGDAEDPSKLPAKVIDSVKVFADPAFGVDVFKLESPIPLGVLPDPDSLDGAHEQDRFDALGKAVGGRPWVMLSAGASMTTFERVVRYACRAGASGFLAGRAVWLDALRAYPDLEAVRRELGSVSVPYLRRLSEVVRREGRPWRGDYDFSAIEREGQFAAGYGSAPAAGGGRA
jgi:tagatose 1,6-diphosphate aldolase